MIDDLLEKGSVKKTRIVRKGGHDVQLYDLKSTVTDDCNADCDA